jgi:hypothetical protein
VKDVHIQIRVRQGQPGYENQEVTAVGQRGRETGLMGICAAPNKSSVVNCTLEAGASVSIYSFLEPNAAFPLPKAFNFEEYIETEQEMWALFPETEGKRVNFCQMGLTAQVFIESSEQGDLNGDETYFLMPCDDHVLRPIRMRAIRRLTLDEFRMVHITAMRLAEKLVGTSRVMDEIHMKILGPEILDGC